MILKNKDFSLELNPLKKQGNITENNMAYLLKRYFGEDNNQYIFNDIYLNVDNINFQIDHLILNPYGFSLIESKSCLGEISFNDKNEWKRKTGTYYQGFKSPIYQLEEQCMLLKRLLSQNSAKLLPKIIGFIQEGFGGRDYDLFVAIDEKAIITRETSKFDHIVFKSEQIPTQIQKNYKKRKKGILSTSVKFNEDSILNIINFILEENEKNNKIQNLKKEINNTKNKEYFCRKCHNQKLEIIYGKYGYYFKCKHCLENINIKEICSTCHQKQRIKKQKNKFFLICNKCNTQKLYHINL